MPSPTEITVPQLARLIGLPNAPRLVDVRTDGEFQSDPYLIPASQRRNGSEVGSWRHHYAAHPVIAIRTRSSLRRFEAVAHRGKEETVPA